MNKWASRLTLEITGIRVERLQDISEQDVIAEGIPKLPKTHKDSWQFWPRYGDGFISHNGFTGGCVDNPKDSYKSLWQSINDDASWTENPWVWVVEFKIHECNVDNFLKQKEPAND
jgi:hypothetical protein